MELPARKLMPALERNVLRDDRAYQGLTAQQWQYVEARVNGLSVVDAYRSVYEPNGLAPESEHRIATSVEANVKVQQRLRARLLEVSSQSTLVPLSADFVLNGIATIAVSSTKDAVRLKGYELLGKALGVFDKAEAAPPPMKTVNDIDEELRKRLAQALKPETIEAEAVEIARNEKPGTEDTVPGSTRERKRKPKG